MPELDNFLSPAAWRGRAAVFACLIAFPFLGFVARQQYPLLSPEVGAGLGLLVATSIALGVICRGVVFQAAVLLVSCVSALVPLQRELARWIHVPLGVIAAVLLVVLGLSMWRLKGRFYLAVAVFTATLLVSSLLRIGAPAHLVTAGPGDHRSGVPAHFLYLVLDEHMGPGGLPDDIEQCRVARARIERMAARWAFTLYPNAYSNYATTFDSLTSALNGRLLQHRRALVLPPSPDAHGVYHLDTGAFRAAVARQGYALRFIQLRSIDFTGGDDKLAFNYEDSIADAGRLPGDWTDRFRLLVGRYQAADLVFARFKGFFPFRFGLRMTFPMSAGRHWPDWLLDEIGSARRPTLFFAHVLSPHGPYMYRPDGTLRPQSEWHHDQDYERLSPSVYRDRYARYAGQVTFIQSQLHYLFAGLNARGLLEPMTVVIHGDHGSRILSQRDGIARLNVSGPASIDRFDYAGRPDKQDLRDRFSVLLAAKRAGRGTGSIDINPISLARVLPSYTGVPPLPEDPAADAAYLFDGAGKPVQISLLDYWRP